MKEGEVLRFPIRFKVVICEICGYQWNIPLKDSLFYETCPACDSAIVHLMMHSGVNGMTGKPWY